MLDSRARQKQHRHDHHEPITTTVPRSGSSSTRPLSNPNTISGGKQAARKTGDQVLLLGQIGREINDRHELGHLGRLNVDAARGAAIAALLWPRLRATGTSTNTSSTVVPNSSGIARFFHMV